MTAWSATIQRPLFSLNSDTLSPLLRAADGEAARQQREQREHAVSLQRSLDSERRLGASGEVVPRRL